MKQVEPVEVLGIKKEIVGKPPFSRLREVNRIVCKLCGEVLRKGWVTDERHWVNIQNHFRVWHKMDIGEGIPIFCLPIKVQLRLIKEELKKEVENGEEDIYQICREEQSD